MAFCTCASHRGVPPTSYAVMPFVLCKSPAHVLSPDRLDALSDIIPVVLGAGTGHARRFPYSACHANLWFPYTLSTRPSSDLPKIINYSNQVASTDFPVDQSIAQGQAPELQSFGMDFF